MFDTMVTAHASPRGLVVSTHEVAGRVHYFFHSYPEPPIERTPENYRELQELVFYADPLFIGRNGAWLSSQAVLLAIAVAQFKEVPIPMVMTLAVSGVLVSVFWFFTAKSLADRIVWLDNELRRFEGSIHARYLSDRRSAASRRWAFHIMTLALPTTFAGAWVLLVGIKCWL